MWVVKAESIPDTQGQTAGCECLLQGSLTQQILPHLLVDIIKCSEAVEMGNKEALCTDLDFLFLEIEPTRTHH